MRVSITLTAAATVPLCPDAPALVIQKNRGSDYVESFLALVPDRGKEVRYAVYVADAYRYYTYEAAVANYYLYPAAGDSFDSESLDELDGWTETYDYLVVWQPDEAYEAYAAERGVDPVRRTWTAEEYRAALLQAHEN